MLHQSVKVCKNASTCKTNLEVSDIRVGEECVLLVGVEEGEVLHDDGDQQVQHDVGDYDVEAAIVQVELQGDNSGRYKPPIDLDLRCSAILLGQ